MIGEMENMWVFLGKQQLEIFEQNCEAYFELLSTAATQRTILSMFYFVSVRSKRIMPIDKLVESDKRDLWESAKEIASGRLDHNQTIELSKCLYTISCFLKG